MIYYYADDGTKFHSKVQALEYGNYHSQNIHLYYYDHIYSRIDWSIEPTESLDYYYKEQAQRIRDNYDYVILCYSGGYDSTNILETFHYNNIKIDKIVSVGAFDQDTVLNSDENHNGELYHNVFPYIKELDLESILQVIDYSKLFDDTKNFSILQYNENWIDYTGGWFSPHNWFWYDLEKHVVPTEWKNKKVGIIFGKDKPLLQQSQHTFCFRDRPITSYGNRTSIDNCDRINFYWDPNYPEILLKQLHVLKKSGAIHLRSYPIDNILYNLRKKLIYKSPKSSSCTLSLRDSYLKNKTNNDAYTSYSQGINEIIHKNVQVEKMILSRYYTF